MVRPTQVDGHLSIFDRMADAVSHFTARAVFFALCVAVVVIWVPSYLVVRDLDIWQLLINTLTTIVTFLLVALLQNTQSRADAAVQRKLNAIAAHLLENTGDTRAELAAAVGLEDRESS